MNHHVTTVRLWIEIFLGATIGSGEILLMTLSDTYPSVGACEFFYPFVVGFLLGIVGRSPVWIIGPATMLFMPIGMVIGMVTGGAGLNLWPIALVFCSVLTLIGLIGAAIGRGAKLYWIKWT